MPDLASDVTTVGSVHTLHSLRVALSLLAAFSTVLCSFTLIVDAKPESGSTPFTGTPVSIPGHLQGHDFDHGGPGVGYFDADAGNAGGAYRLTDVDIEASAGGGFNVGWTAPGEWLNYTVSVGTAGSYAVELRVASPESGRSLHIGFNGPSQAWTQVFVPNSGGWQNWQTLQVPVTLGAGVQQITIFFDTGRVNLGAITVSDAATGAPPMTGSGALPAMVFPGPHWLEAAPESQGVDSAKLHQAISYLERNAGTDGVHELLVVRHGRILAQGSNVTTVHGTWSVTKGLTSMMLGLLVDDGRISEHALAKHYVPALAEQYPAVTLKQFAAMTSGYRAQGDANEPGSHGQSGTPFTPDTPLFNPGAGYAYWDSAANAYGLAITRIAQEPLHALFQQRVADPIGIDRGDWHWDELGTVDGLVVNTGAGNMGSLNISAKDLARIGLLYLNRGNWNGTQVISAAWVSESTSNQVPATLPLGNCIVSQLDGRGVYGYGWWTNGWTAPIRYDANCHAYEAVSQRFWPDAPAGTYALLGANNNRLYVIPEWNMVIVRMGQDQESLRMTENTFNNFLKMVGESLTAF